METKTEQQTCSWVHSSDCICHLCLTPKPAAPPTEQPVNERAARLAELTERAKQVAEEIHKEVCAVNPYEGDVMPFVSINKGYNDPTFGATVGLFDKNFSGMPELIGELSAFRPVSNKENQIAFLEAKLAALKGGAK